jgi:hypothetical protein
MIDLRLSFPIRSWVDPPHVCKHSGWRAFHFRHYRTYFCLPATLSTLHFRRLPHSGYISPEAMVACLSSLNRLKHLDLGFESPQSRPDQPSPPPQTRVVLPALTNLSFTGMTDYSEDFLARIDTPVLNNFSMSSFPDLVFGCPTFQTVHRSYERSQAAQGSQGVL